MPISSAIDQDASLRQPAADLHGIPDRLWSLFAPVYGLSLDAVKAEIAEIRAEIGSDALLDWLVWRHYDVMNLAWKPRPRR